MNTIQALESLLKMAEECTKDCVDDSQEILNELCYHAPEYKSALEEALKLVKEKA